MGHYMSLMDELGYERLLDLGAEEIVDAGGTVLLRMQSTSPSEKRYVRVSRAPARRFDATMITRVEDETHPRTHIVAKLKDLRASELESALRQMAPLQAPSTAHAQAC